MNNVFYTQLEEKLTANRLAVYQQDGVNYETCISRYLYNIAICKALYPSLHIYEIVLRNSISIVLSDCAKVQNWYDVLSLDTESKNKIEEAKRKIKKHGKTVTPDRIIAELTLGFWTSFLTPKYSQKSFQPLIIKRCFKDVPKNQRNIKSIQKILEKMRLLRNRVSHYERLIHWKDLQEQHDQLLECICWLSKESYQLANHIDSFNDVYSAGIQPFKEIIQHNWN